jgi:hypothetical protein
MYEIYLRPLHMFRQTNSHLQGLFIRELQEVFTSKYSVYGYTLKNFTEHTHVMVLAPEVQCFFVSNLKSCTFI